MKAQELRDKYLKAEVRDKVSVIAIGKDFWFHVHNDEEVDKKFTIALYPRDINN